MNPGMVSDGDSAALAMSEAAPRSAPVIEPSPYLELLRLEREEATGPLRHPSRAENEAASAGTKVGARAGTKAGAEADAAVSAGAKTEATASAGAEAGSKAEAAEAGAEADAEADADATALTALVRAGVIEPSDADEEPEGEVREIVVRRSPFVTPEGVFRYLLRSMDKKPRLLNPTRALARLGGRVRVVADGGSSPAAVRRYARALVEDSRPRLKDCIAHELAADPRVVIKEPSGLVFEQALRFEDGVYRFSVDARIEDGQLEIQVAEATGDPTGDDTRACIGAALSEGRVGRPEAEGPVALRMPVVVFIQQAQAAEGSAMAASLALQAALVGWLHYERGDFAEARESFLDATWAYRLPEYQALLGRAEEALGRPRHAISAYQKYIDQRREAPDAPAIARRIEALRESLEGEAGGRPGRSRG